MNAVETKLLLDPKWTFPVRQFSSHIEKEEDIERKQNFGLLKFGDDLYAFVRTFLAA